MPRAVKQTLILWVSLLVLSGLTLLILRLPTLRTWMWDQTGEEAFGAQVKGLTDLASDLLRPRLQLAPDVNIQHADVNPFGVNVSMTFPS